MKRMFRFLVRGILLLCPRRFFSLLHGPFVTWRVSVPANRERRKASRIDKTPLVGLMSLVPLVTFPAEDLGAMWGTAEAESRYYKLVDIPIPHGVPLRVGAMEDIDEQRLAVGTRKGDIYVLDGAFDPNPNPKYHLFASGQDEIFGLSRTPRRSSDKLDLLVTQFGGVNRIRDTDGDGLADRFDTLSSHWGYAEGHEFAFGSKPDPEGSIWVALGLTGSYHSRQLFRGWCLKITPDGRTIPICSGLRSPAGVNANHEEVMFAVESQGPWNGSCSLKHLKPGGFLGHPASYNWYEFAEGIPKPELEPESKSRIKVEKRRVKELVPPAVLFPYIKMGRSISGFQLDETGGKFGPFTNQFFLGDYTLSIILRASTEQVNGVWQGACYPFREGLSTGIMNVEFTPKGQLMAGGFRTNRQWPVRGTKAYDLQRLEWTGVMPFEIQEIKIRKEGFLILFTRPVDRVIAASPQTYTITTYTHIFGAGYGSPEVDHTTAEVMKAEPAANGLSVLVYLKTFEEGHIHDFDLGAMKSAHGEALLHKKAYYTVNEVPP